MSDSVLYCTFWYPTIFHQELKRLYPSDHDFSAVISDGSDNTYDVRVTLDESENLIVESILNKNSKKEKSSFILKLVRTKHHRNGFVQYSFKTDDIPPGRVKDFKTILVKDIYHIAKQFYHQHEADSGKDAALRALITSGEGGINGNNNKFLIGFLENYTPVFEKYARNISDANSQIQFREKRINAIEKLKSDTTLAKLQPYKRSVLKRSMEVNELCENACIEYTYCKTLLSSLYNKSFDHNLKIEGSYNLEKKKAWRRSALNIRNAMRYIENIKYKNQNRLNKLVQLLLEELNEVAAEVKSNTHHIEKALEQLNNVTREVNSSTNNIEKALQQGKRSENLNYTLAFLSIYTSLVLGISPDNFISPGYVIPGTELTLGKLCNIVVIIIFLGFVGFLIWLRKRKMPEIPR